MRDVSWAQANAFRLRRHCLSPSALPDALLSVVSGTCGMQAQVMSAAQLALRVRVPGILISEIERALWQDRVLVKAWSMRGTLHVLPADELPLYVAALGPYRLLQEQRWMARYGVDAAAIAAMADAILSVLTDVPLTRRQLSQAVLARLKKHAPQIQDLVEHGWGGLGKYVCLQGNLCLGPNQGQEATFVRRDRWLADWDDIPGEEAEAWLLRKFLHAYGPATVQDFAFWAGMSVRDARRIWRGVERDMCAVTIAGSPAAILEPDLPALMERAQAPETVHLLPHFDVFLLGHRSKSHLVDESHYKRVYRAAGWISPVVLIDGRVEGVWSHSRGGRVLRVLVEPFGALSARQRSAIKKRAADVAAFCDSPLELAYTGTSGTNPAN